MLTTPDIFNAWREASRLAAEAERDVLQATLNTSDRQLEATERARRLRAAASALLEQLLVELQDERARAQLAHLAGAPHPGGTGRGGGSGMTPLQ
jgi:hypothetical protein